MKKLLKIFLLFIVLFSLVGYVNVSKAATEEDIITYLSKPFTISGQTVYVPNEYIKEARRYFSTHELTSTQADEILEKAKEAAKILEKEGQIDAKNLSHSAKEEILSKAQEAAAIVGAKVTFANGKILVTDENGKLFGAYSTQMITKPTFAQTGADYTAIFLSSGIIIIAIITTLVYRRKISAK